MQPGANPLEVSSRALVQRYCHDFRQFIGMMFAERGLDAPKQGDLGLGDQQAFLGGFDRVIPRINGRQAGHQIDAGCRPLAHQPFAQLAGDRGVGAGAKN